MPVLQAIGKTHEEVLRYAQNIEQSAYSNAGSDQVWWEKDCARAMRVWRAPASAIPPHSFLAHTTNHTH